MHSQLCTDVGWADSESRIGCTLETNILNLYHCWLKDSDYYGIIKTNYLPLI